MSLRDIVLVLVVLCALPMALVRPMVGLWLWVGFSYMNPHRLTWGFATTFPWVQIVAIVTLFSLFMHPEDRQAIRWKPICVLLVLFLIQTSVSSAAAVKPDAAWVHWMDLAKVSVLFFVTLSMVIDRKRMDSVIWAIVLSFGFWSAKGGLFTIRTGGHWDVVGPVHSYFHDNNMFALVMCMVLPLMRYLQLTSSNKWVRRFLWVLMGLTVISILGTYSRGGLLALGAMSFMLILKSRNRISLLTVAIVLGAAMFVFMPQKYTARMSTIDDYQQDASAMGRIHSWQFATNVALARPLLGGGFEVWASHDMWFEYGPPGATHRAIHSIYFSVLGQQGILGLLIYLGFAAAAWLGLGRIRKSIRAGPETKWMEDLASMLQVSLVAFLSAGTFLPIAYLPFFFQLLSLVVALQVLAAREILETKPVRGSAGPLANASQNALRQQPRIQHHYRQ